MKEIARLAEVSIGTVDRVLHGRGRVSAANVARIEAIVAELGYKPNVFASRLSGGTTRTLGVVMPFPEQDFGYWGQIRLGMDRAAREWEPLHVSVKFAGFNRSSGEAAAAALASLGAVDALAIAPIHATLLRPVLEALAPEVPLVVFDTDLHVKRSRCFVGQDPWRGGRLAAKLLDWALPPGKSLALLRFVGDDEHLARRAEGFAAFAAERGREVAVIDQDTAVAGASRRAEAERFLVGHPEVGALFVPNAAVGEYAGLPVARLAGYDLTDTSLTALKAGRLDFVLSQRPQFMGFEAVRRLARQLVFGEVLPPRVPVPLDVVLAENADDYDEGLGAGLGQQPAQELS